jgi:hypothetical protein
MVANSSEKLVKAHQMIANIRTRMSSQTNVIKTIIMTLLIHLFVYHMSKLCKVLTQYTSCKAVNIAKSSIRK